jgi:transcriptional regulator with XRE-family HTH domain
MPERTSAKVIPLGERLRQHREEQGLSQAQAARELDVARTAYRLWELEAAKPSPDRWRLIARWLGVSISTMLLGEDLIDQEDAVAADRIANRAANGAEERWDDIAASSPGDFFEQERSTIAHQLRSGRITTAESGKLTALLDHVLEGVESRADQPAAGAFRKEMVADNSAPEIARTALVVTAAGVNESIIDRAELLTSELVTDAVERSDGSLWLAITLHPDLLRVEAAAESARMEQPRSRDQRSRWSLTITSELASRWGAGWESDLYVSWFEIDLPGASSVWS